MFKDRAQDVSRHDAAFTPQFLSVGNGMILENVLRQVKAEVHEQILIDREVRPAAFKIAQTDMPGRKDQHSQQSNNGDRLYSGTCHDPTGTQSPRQHTGLVTMILAARSLQVAATYDKMN